MTSGEKSQAWAAKPHMQVATLMSSAQMKHAEQAGKAVSLEHEIDEVVRR
jgi:hypothetical protein